MFNFSRKPVLKLILILLIFTSLLFLLPPAFAAQAAQGKKNKPQQAYIFSGINLRGMNYGRI